MTLELRGVTKEVGGQVWIHPADLTLAPGSMNVLLGPTLSGKTTLMRLMAGLDQPSAGRIFWHGQDVRRTAEMMRLTPMLNRRPLELSGGQQQRTALARALVKGAGLVLLDEPLANLDYKLREELRAEIPRIFEASGAIFVYATTEPEAALLLGGNPATLWEGRVTQFGPTPQVYRAPRDAVTARVFSDPPMNFKRIEVRGGEALLDAARWPVDVPDGRYTAGFRAPHLTLEQSPRAVPLSARVAATEITGAESYLHLLHGEDRWVGLVPGVRKLPTDAPLTIWLDPAHVYLFDEGGRLARAAPYAQAA